VNIKKEHLKTLWYEDMEGNELEAKEDGFPTKERYIQVSRFPYVLRTNYIKVEDNKSERLFSGESTWGEGLVLNIANSGDYSLSESIIIAAESCERCLNVLIDKYGGYGKDEGYKEYSEKWHKCGTSCKFCAEEDNQ